MLGVEQYTEDEDEGAGRDIAAPGPQGDTNLCVVRLARNRTSNPKNIKLNILFLYIIYSMHNPTKHLFL